MLTRKLLMKAAAAVAIAWVMGTLGLDHASAQDTRWIVSEVTGGAKIEGADGTVLDAEPELAVSPGARIATGDGGRLRLTDGASIMTLSSGTEVEIRDAPEDASTSIFQRIGVLLLQVERRRQEHFEVETPYLAALVKGTRFSVSVADTGAAVHVTDGMVEVSSPAASEPVLVHPGQTATVDAHALDTIRLDGGRSENVLPGPAAGTEQEQVIRSPIGVVSVDIAAATDGLVGSGTLAATGSIASDEIAAAGDVGEAAAMTGSLTGLVGGATGATGQIATGGLGGAVGSTGSAIGGTVGGAGSAIGGTVGGASGVIGNTVQNSTNTVANTTNNLGTGLGNLLQGF